MASSMDAAGLKTRAAIGVALSWMSVLPSQAQQRGNFLCKEDVSIRLVEPEKPDDAKTRSLTARAFSITWNREFLNLIYAGGTEYYECIPIIPRLDERKPKNSMKCQNGIYFITVDLTNLKFVRAQLNPQDITEVGVSFGACKPIN